MRKRLKNLNDVVVFRIKGSNYLELNKKKNRFIEGREDLLYSNAYSNNNVFISFSEIEHGMDVEERVLTSKQLSLFLTKRDKIFLEEIGSNDTRIIWVLKEALIKISDGLLYDMIYNKMNIVYMDVIDDNFMIGFNESILYFKYSYVNDAVVGVVGTEKIGRILISNREEELNVYL